MKQRYQDRWKVFLKRMIVSIDYLQTLSDDTVDELAYSLKQEIFDAGTHLFHKGDHINHIYILTEGELEILVDSDIKLDILW